MSGNHEKSGLQKPTLIEKLANDPMRYILFFTSFSVILITLGIIPVSYTHLTLPTTPYV